MSQITVVDFGAGNLLSVVRAFKHLGADIVLAATPQAVLSAQRLVLPGVGAFGACMDGLSSRGLIEPVMEFARRGNPFMGICVGLQMLFEESDEFGLHKGLSLIPGRVERISPWRADGGRRKVPHIGWNGLRPANGAGWDGTPLQPLKEGTGVYFVHSFVARPDNAAHQLAVCNYEGSELLAAAKKDNIVGCQFHPEKSGPAGLAILRQFMA